MKFEQFPKPSQENKNNTAKEKPLFGGEQKIQEYVDRIKKGESKDLIFKDLPESFRIGIERGLGESLVNENNEQKESENNPFEKMNQDEFADWLSQNLTEEEFKKVGMYNLLTARPEFRALVISDSLKKSGEEPELYQRRLSMLPALKKWATESEGVIRKYIKNNEGIIGVEGSGWQHYKINESEIPREKDRIKGYISLAMDGLFDKFNSEVMSNILETLKTQGYHGQVKFPQQGGGLYERFDNIVIHGNNDIETQKALKIIKEVLDKYQIATIFQQVGRDGIDENGKKTSHTDLLSQKVEGAIKKRFGLSE